MKVTLQTTQTVKRSATVIVTAPGVSHDIIVNTNSESVAIIGAEAKHSEFFDFASFRVSGINAAGI